MVFDVPNHTGTYEERYHLLGWFLLLRPLSQVFVLQYLYPSTEKRLAEKDHPHLALARYHKCIDTVHFDTLFQDIIDGGGEGIILRDPQASYEPGRSSSYLKHKV